MSKKEAPMTTDRPRIYREARYDFTQQEIRELGRDMAREAQGVYDARAQKVATVAELSSLIKSAEKRVSDFAEKINCGYELRPIECIEILDSPRPGRKSVVRTDTQEVLEETAMSESELQESFAFPEGKPQ
jgi:hypothetical protein